MTSSTEGPVLVIGAAGCIGAAVVANLVRAFVEKRAPVFKGK